MYVGNITAPAVAGNTMNDLSPRLMTYQTLAVGISSSATNLWGIHGGFDLPVLPLNPSVAVRLNLPFFCPLLV